MLQALVPCDCPGSVVTSRSKFLSVFPTAKDDKPVAPMSAADIRLVKLRIFYAYNRIQRFSDQREPAMLSWPRPKSKTRPNESK